MLTILSKLLNSLFGATRYYVSGMVNRVDQHHAFLMSGGLAFSLFVCAVPLALVVFAALSNLFERPTVASEISALVDRIVPYPDYAVSVREFIDERLKHMSDFKEVVGIIGIAGLLVASTGLFSSLRTILNAAYRTEDIESAVVGKLWDFALIILVLVLFVVLILALPAIEAAIELAGEVEWLQRMGFSSVRNILLNGATFVTLFAAFSSIYWLVPVRKQNWRTIVVSALVASALWLIAKELFGFYVSHAATLRHVYGVYAFLVVSAFWIYYSALILIVAAEFGQLYSERRGLAGGQD